MHKQDIYNRFSELCTQKKYSLVYAMSIKYPYLQQTTHYKNIEIIWNKSFQQAQKEILNGDINKAKEILHKYITVTSKREIIKFLTQDSDIYIESIQAIKEKRYQKVYDLSMKTKTLVHLPAYILFNKEIQDDITTINLLIKEENIESAKMYMNKYKGIEYLSEYILKSSIHCKDIQALHNAYEENDFIKCYEIIDSSEYLESSQIAILLERHWKKLIYKCEIYAQNGKIQDIKTTFGELIKVQTRRAKIGNLLKISFHYQIKLFVSEKNYIDAESLIYSYIDIFGQDNELKNIMNLFETRVNKKLALSITQNEKYSKDFWTNS